MGATTGLTESDLGLTGHRFGDPWPVAIDFILLFVAK